MDMGLSCKICLLSALLSILATLAGLMYHMSGSVLSVHEQPHVEGSDDILQYYEKTDLARFVRKNQRELLLAQKDRRLECGTIVDVSDIECEFCALLVNVLRKLVMSGKKTEESIADFATFVCIIAQIEDERVCKTVVEEFKPGSPTIRVLHITDYHLDAEYQAGSNAQCGEPLCCREDDGPPGPGEAGAGKYGDYQKCDAAPITVDNLFKHLMSIEDSFDYVIFTGDIPPHNIWNQSKSDQISALDVFTEYALRYLPNKKVFNTLGNHESAPVNSFPPPFVTGNDSESWLYDAAAKSWLNWLPAATATTIRKWLYVNATDPAGMLQWFISELQDAENVGDKVHVIGHIYPGCDCCLKPWSYNYYKIVNRYENTITGQFFGHEHSMRYQVFYDEETLKRPLGVSFLPGSITTYTKLNPGYRIYEIDGNYQNSSWRVLDYTNFFMNLTHANLFDEVIWQKEYSAKDAYGLHSLFPQDWNDLIYRMKADDNLFKLFCTHSSKSGPNNCDTCTGDCKRDSLCNLKTARNGDPNICKDL